MQQGNHDPVQGSWERREAVPAFIQETAATREGIVGIFITVAAVAQPVEGVAPWRQGDCLLRPLKLSDATLSAHVNTLRRASVLVRVKLALRIPKDRVRAIAIVIWKLIVLFRVFKGGTADGGQRR